MPTSPKATKSKATKVPPASEGTGEQPAAVSSPNPDSGTVLALPVLLTPPITFYGARHIEMRLTADQSRKITALMYSLMHQGEEIQRAPDALRWLIDQLPMPEDFDAQA